MSLINEVKKSLIDFEGESIMDEQKNKGNEETIETVRTGGESLEMRVRELDAREAALDLRERQGRMRAELLGRELPETLLDCLDLSSDERAEATLETLSGAFHDAVNRKVKSRLGAEPPRAAAAAQDALAAVRRAMGLK